MQNSTWPPVYRHPSPSALRKWIKRDDKSKRQFLQPDQRNRYELRLSGLSEPEWPKEVWPKKNGKRHGQ